VLAVTPPLLHLASWARGRIGGDVGHVTEEALVEGVWPRAKRDAKKSGTGTFSGGVTLVLGTAIGVHLAGKDHAPSKSPSLLVEIGFPIVGFIAAAVFILLVRLVLTFRVQRNEARLALREQGAQLALRPADPQVQPTQIAEYHAHGPTFLAATPELLRQTGLLSSRFATETPLPEKRVIRPTAADEPQISSRQADHESDGVAE
jgi:hypothetical protein